MNKKIQKWIDKNISIDLVGKDVYITGANSGIGFEIAKEVVYLGANLTMLVRNLEKGRKAKEKIEQEFNTQVNILELDLASKESILNCVNKIKNDNLNIDIFINNAGVYHLPKGKTKDGFEITMGTNYYGTLFLNDLLNKYFITLNHKVVNILTTSISIYLTKIDYLDFDNIKEKSPVKLYAKSKLAVANLYYTYVDEYINTNLVFHLVHPGVTYTPLIVKAYSSKVFRFLASVFMKLFFHTPEKAALTSILAITSNENCIVGPRGLLQISGYPKFTKLKKDREYIKCTKLGREKLESN